MLTQAQKRVKAEELFVFNFLNVKQLSELGLGTEKTIGKWRKDGNWDEKQAAVLANPSQARQLLLKELISIAKGNKPTFDTDALSKVSKVLGSITGKITPEVIVAVIQMLDTWQAERYPQLAVESLPVHKEFLREIIDVNDY